MKHFGKILIAIFGLSFSCSSASLESNTPQRADLSGGTRLFLSNNHILGIRIGGEHFKSWIIRIAGSTEIFNKE